MHDLLRRARTRLDLRGLFQAGLLVAAFVIVGRLVSGLNLPIGAGPLGFGLVLLALSSRLLPVSLVEGGARWLMARSALFFIPAVVSVGRQIDFLAQSWLPLAVVVVGGTVLTLVATALVVDLACRVVIRKHA